ncbi:uncharacterized protein LOC125549000 isoform X1 [Triticum urartu]|uniref:uncharacterized protein LOC125549000 isoform X1 n=1 Tax=Triticum urartu TaxID=4572 RepID=UPI002043317D|nr:uncharacterized protein LOC125549000 isoform X1 [Triticum urartu]
MAAGDCLEPTCARPSSTTSRPTSFPSSCTVPVFPELRVRYIGRPDLLLHVDVVGLLASGHPTLPRVAHDLLYPETAGDPQFDYGVDDPSLLPELPDVGVQEPDATVDDDYHYSGGAYYYVQPADDD